MTIPEQELGWRIRHAIRDRIRRLDSLFDWTFIQLLVRDPLIERSALGLLALITALLLFKSRFVSSDGGWLEALDGRLLASSAGDYGVFFGIWFTALLTNAAFCPRVVREAGNRDRALESYRKATDHATTDPGFIAFERIFDTDNQGRPLVRTFIVLLLVAAFAEFFASLRLLILATSSLLG